MYAATQRNNPGEDEFEGLMERLRNHPLNSGPSAGGPVWGIMPDEVTNSIIAQGGKIVASLIKELSKSDWTESVYIVFCLREMKAKGAIPSVLLLKKQLMSDERFENEHHNFTLEVQIDSYLRESSKW